MIVIDNAIVPLYNIRACFNFEILSFVNYFQHNVDPLLRIVWHIDATLHLSFGTKLGIIFVLNVENN